MKISLKYKLFILIFLTISISLGISSYIYYTNLYDEYYNDSYKSTKDDLMIVKSHMNEHADKLTLISDALVKDKALQVGLNLISNYEDKKNYNSVFFDEEKKKLLKDLSEKTSVITDLSFGLFDKNGDLVLLHRGVDKKRYEGIVTYKDGVAMYKTPETKRLFKLPNLVPPTQDNIKKRDVVLSNCEFALKYTQDVYHNNRLVGYLRIKKVFSKNNINLLTNSLKNSFSFITDKFTIGNRINIDKDFIFQNSTPFLNREYSLDDMLINNEYFLHPHYIDTFRGNKLYLLSAYDKEHLYEKINIINKQLLLSILISMFISLFIAYIFLKQTMLNPMNSLMINIEMIKRGEYSNLLEIHTQDEIGDIANSFNSMAHLVKERELELINTQENLKQAQLIAQLGSWELEHESNEIKCSDEMYNILKREQDSQIKTFDMLFEYIDKADKERFKKLFDNSLSECREFEFEHRIERADGSIGYVQSKARHHYSKDGNVVRSIGTMLDISEIRELEKSNIQKEQMLFQQSKMASMGEMIGNIAHQWRQPISVVSMWANNIIADVDMELVDNENLKKYANNINKQTKHLSETIDDFRNFFTPNKVKNSFTLKESIDKTMSLLVASFKTDNIEVIEEIEDIEITALENELTQAILNIIKNAKDIIVTLDNNGRKLIFINVYKKESNVIIEVIDNGGGIPKDIINKVFEPYFTTKHKSQGTGIGLYMTESIITKHLGGRIDVQNVEYTYDDVRYKGAKFTIELELS